MKKWIWAGFLLAMTDQAAAQGYNSLRLAYINTPRSYTLPDLFLQRAQSGGYNYILCQIQLDLSAGEWCTATGTYTGHSGCNTGVTQDLLNGITALFRQVDRFGMRMIPLFQLGGKWAGHWRTVNSNIRWQMLDFNVATNSGTQPSDMPVLAPDPTGVRGIDASFDELMWVLQQGFNNAGLGYPLEYVHLGHDEAHCDPGECPGAPKLLAGQSAEDRNWMANNGNSIPRLLGHEIRRRVDQVSSRFPTARVIIYGDMWDPDHNGDRWGVSSVVSSTDAQAVRSNLIITPWYNDPFFNGRNYDPQKTYRHFMNNGFNFLVGFEIWDDGTPAPFYKIRQLGENLARSAEPEFRNANLGYTAQHWTSWLGQGIYDQRLHFMSMEYLSHLHRFMVPSYFQ